MIALPFADNYYSTIYADPPWPERGGGQIRRGANRHYPLMPVSEIVEMGPEVRRVSAPDAHLYLWVTNNFLLDAAKVLEAWGFRYITCITWLKDKAGLGQYYRGKTEHCLFAVRGRIPYRVSADGTRAQGVTGFTAPRLEHSAKPHIMRQMIESVSPGPYLELFARARCPSWDTWGNDVNKQYGGQVGFMIEV